MAEFVIHPLNESTWPAFADLVERHSGVWGGCWCMGFHSEGVGRDRSAQMNRDDKFRRVTEGRAHAALVFDGDRCVGWCQFGSLDELPRIKARKAYDSGPATGADWRITCFFVDKEYRRRGVSDAALAGAVDAIASSGGGVVESFPEDTTDRKVSSSFLHNATTSMFEKQGFSKVRRLGKDRWLVSRTVAPRR